MIFPQPNFWSIFFPFGWGSQSQAPPSLQSTKPGSHIRPPVSTRIQEIPASIGTHGAHVAPRIQMGQTAKHKATVEALCISTSSSRGQPLGPISRGSRVFNGGGSIEPPKVLGGGGSGKGNTFRAAPVALAVRPTVRSLGNYTIIQAE